MQLARNLKVECVSRLHPTLPHHLNTHQTVADAVAMMRKEKVGCVLIIEEGHLHGIFTERDLMRRVLALALPLSTPLARVMTSKPVTVQPQDSIAMAIRRMQEGGYRHLPVVDGSQRPVGILSVKRIVQYLAEHFPATVHNQPPAPGSFPSEAEGA